MADIVGLIISCGEIAKALLDVYETLDGAPAAITEVLGRIKNLQLLLQRLQALKQQLSSDQQAFFSTYFNQSECYKTIDGLKKLTDQTKANKQGIRHDLKGRFKWLWNKSEVEALVGKLDQQQSAVLMAISMISSESIQTILTILSRTQPTKAFNDAPLAQSSTQGQPPAGTGKKPSSTIKVSAIPFEYEQPVVNSDEKPAFASNGPHIWFGQRYDTEELRLNPGYVHDRASLANAAYVGHWSRVIKHVQTGSREYNQRWINCVRMGNNPKYEISGFTPLHQAAYLGAPVDVVKRLISMGAWRMARTLREPEKDMTPLDIARSAGFEHLYEILSPLIKHTIPFVTILALEQQLHILIQHEAEADERLKNLRLPDLTVLLEFEVMEMWFPMTSLSAEGFMLRIDGRELLVKSTWESRKGKLYRVTASTIVEIQEAVVVHR